MNTTLTREALGWGPHFLQQLSLEEYERCRPGRILQQHKSQLEVATEDDLQAIHDRMSAAENVTIEFPPETVGNGPRKHMMCYEPGGIRVEFIWPGQ